MSPAALMRPMQLRRLTPAETRLAEEMFHGRLDAGRVRIFAAPLWRRAFVPSGALVVWPAVAARLDFGAQDTPLGEQATFIHELTHVWQAQRGVNLVFAKLKAGDAPQAYAYDLRHGCDFAALNIEQQAMVVEHAFLAGRGAPAPYPAEAYLAALPDWRSA
jgi:hypothetical protein